MRLLRCGTLQERRFGLSIPKIQDSCWLHEFLNVRKSKKKTTLIEYEHYRYALITAVYVQSVLAVAVVRRSTMRQWIIKMVATKGIHTWEWEFPC